MTISHTPRMLGSGPGPQLEPLFDDLYRRAVEGNGSAPIKLRDWVELAEAWRIASALRECRGNRSAAARALGIGRRTLYSKMERLGVSPAWGVWSTPTKKNGSL
jgi:DNA-binding NtrC family response regulator